MPKCVGGIKWPMRMLKVILGRLKEEVGFKIPTTRSRNIFGARITLIQLFARLFNKWRLKSTIGKLNLPNQKMTIALTDDRSTTDISDELLERWLELWCCFSV